MSGVLNIFNLQERGRMLISHGDEVYEGQVVGIHNRDNDLVVNPLKGKQLTNVRASGTDESIILTPPIKMTLEQALEFIQDDELVEVTPESIRIRKKLLSENDLYLLWIKTLDYSLAVPVVLPKALPKKLPKKPLLTVLK